VNRIRKEIIKAGIIKNFGNFINIALYYTVGIAKGQLFSKTGDMETGRLWKETGREQGKDSVY
jgi:hypothetical protein